MRIHSSITRCCFVFWALLLAISPILGREGENTNVPSLGEEEARVAFGPEAAFKTFVEAARENDWAACSQMMHPEALAEFHRAFTSIARSDESGEVARMFFGVESGEDVVKLSPSSSFERVMQAIIAMYPGTEEIFGTSETTILGSVPEGEVIHIVYRVYMEIEGGSVSKIAVASFKRDGDQWRALLTGDMEGMIQAFQGQMAD